MYVTSIAWPGRGENINVCCSALRGRLRSNIGLQDCVLPGSPTQPQSDNIEENVSCSLVIIRTADHHQQQKMRRRHRPRPDKQEELPVLSVVLVLVVIDGARSLLLPVLTIECVLQRKCLGHTQHSHAMLPPCYLCCHSSP